MEMWRIIKNKMAKEWSLKWNPFNSDKLIAHVDKWKSIQRGGKIQAPVTVTVDPINACDLSCSWCNADYILKHNKNMLSKETLEDIAKFLPEWGTKAVCVAGGGEPLLNPYTSHFLYQCSLDGVKTGVVTNGTQINKHRDALKGCSWVGVSIDSGNSKTYEKLKGKDRFGKVIKNIEGLVNSSENFRLGSSGQGHGVSYKYLLHPGNVNDVYEATKIAKEIGCRNMHIRPFGDPWNKIGKVKDKFSYSDIQEFKEQIVKARELEDENFRVFGITHKFDGDFRKKNDFENCYAIFMTGVFMPPSSNGKFDYGLCCDRRGDEKMTLRNLTDTKEVKDYWGSKEHWNVFDKIDVNKCPRCTYQPHNIIYEKVIKEDNTTYDFI